MSNRDYSILVVGLDGATFDLMLPWIDEGHLPCLGGLLDRGTHSRLASTVPPITPCAWSSFMTGKNPGKHGLFDFVEPVPGSHGFQFTNASCRHGESIWGYLSRLQRRVGVVNVPMTYPPEEVNGYLISGLDTPHEHSQYTYPAEIKQELKDASIDYRIDLQHLGNMRTDARRQSFLDETFAAESARTESLLHLSQKYPADFRMIVYGATDQVQHHFWHYMDPNHDKFDAEGAKTFNNAIRDTYIHVDGLMSSLLEKCDEKTIVVVMSDHGFGPTTNVRLRLNQILETAGLLKFVEEKSAGRLKRVLAGALDGLLRSTLSSDAKRTIAGLFPRLRVWFESLDEAEVDWDRTQAYVNEAYRSSPAIWMNKSGAQQDNNTDEVIDEVEKILRLVVDPQTKEPLIGNVYRTRDLYHGPYADNAPELLPSWWEDGFLLDQSIPGGPEELRGEISTHPIQGGVEFAGSHRIDGVFMMAGGPVHSGLELAGADITDVTPTMLYLMGMPVPSDMDGRVLTECLDDEFVKQNPIEYADPESGSDDENQKQTQSFTDDESTLIAQRLQALGYIK